MLPPPSPPYKRGPGALGGTGVGGGKISSPRAREGGVIVGKPKKTTKINARYAEVAELFRNMPENQFKLIEPQIRDEAFLKISLEDMRAQINAAGYTDNYRNGAAQDGEKVSAVLQAYNQTKKRYDDLVEKLFAKLPKTSGEGKLEAFLNEA